jgi:hypothetical protein
VVKKLKTMVQEQRGRRVLIGKLSRPLRLDASSELTDREIVGERAQGFQCFALRC